MGCIYPECSCAPLYYQCKRGGCVPVSKVCNGFYECYDQSDELDCVMTDRIKPTPQWYSVIPVVKYTKDNSSATEFVMGRLHPQLCTDLNWLPCSQWPGSLCYPRGYACVFDRYSNLSMMFCNNGEHLNNCNDIYCSRMFKCIKSFCIPVRMVCDGVWDCFHGLDENGCSKFHCTGRYNFICKEGTCLHPSEVCDNVFHCPYSGEDEHICALSPCPSLCKCLGYALMCVGKNMSTLPAVSTNVRSIILARNELKRCIIQSSLIFLYLFYLDLSSNWIDKLTQSSFIQIPWLRELDLTNNVLQMFHLCTFSHLKQLCKLVLSENVLMQLEPNRYQHLYSLQILRVGDSNIQLVDTHAFLGLHHLEILDLADNFIQRLQCSMWNELPNIKVLNLSNNQLRDLQIHNDIGFNFGSLQELWSSHYEICCMATTIEHCHPKPEEPSMCNRIIPLYHDFPFLFVPIFTIIINVISVIYSVIIRAGRVTDNLHMCMSLMNNYGGIYTLIIIIADKRYGQNYILIRYMWLRSYWCQSARFLTLFATFGTLIIHCAVTLGRFVAIVLVFKGVKYNASSNQYTILTLLFIFAIIGISCITPSDILNTHPSATAVCFPPLVHSIHIHYKIATIMQLCLMIICIIWVILGHIACMITVLNSRKRVTREYTARSISKPFLLEAMIRVVCPIALILLVLLLHLQESMHGIGPILIPLAIVPMHGLIYPIFFVFLTKKFRERCKIIMASMIPLIFV